MEVSEVDFFLLGPSLAKNARDEGGYSRFVLLDTRQGAEVADAARFAEAARNVKPTSKDLEEQVNQEARRHRAVGKR